MSVDDGADPHTQSASAVREGRPVEAQYARGGRKNGRVLAVLLISLLLAAIVTFVIWFMNAPGLGGRGGMTSVDGSSFNQMNPRPIEKPSQQPAVVRQRTGAVENAQPAS